MYVLKGLINELSLVKWMARRWTSKPPVFVPQFTYPHICHPASMSHFFHEFLKQSAIVIEKNLYNFTFST